MMEKLDTPAPGRLSVLLGEGLSGRHLVADRAVVRPGSRLLDRAAEERPAFH